MVTHGGWPFEKEQGNRANPNIWLSAHVGRHLPLAGEKVGQLAAMEVERMWVQSEPGLESAPWWMRSLPALHRHSAGTPLPPTPLSPNHLKGNEC